MLFCPQCGTKADAGHAFCSACGTKLPIEPVATAPTPANPESAGATAPTPEIAPTAAAVSPSSVVPTPIIAATSPSPPRQRHNRDDIYHLDARPRGGRKQRHEAGDYRCDLCARTLSQSQAVIVQPVEMRVIAENNYGERLTVGQSVSPNERNAWFKELARHNDTPWALCRKCYEGTRPYAKRQPASNAFEDIVGPMLGGTIILLIVLVLFGSTLQWGAEYFFNWSFGPEFLRTRWLRIVSVVATALIVPLPISGIIAEVVRGVRNEKPGSNDFEEIFGKCLIAAYGIPAAVVGLAAMAAGLQWNLEYFFSYSIGPDFLRIPAMQYGGIVLTAVMSVALVGALLGGLVSLVSFRGSRGKRVDIILNLSGASVLQFGAPIVFGAAGGFFGAALGFCLAIIWWYLRGAAFLVEKLTPFNLDWIWDWTWTSVDGDLLWFPVGCALLLGPCGFFTKDKEGRMAFGYLGAVLGLFLGVLSSYYSWFDAVPALSWRIDYSTLLPLPGSNLFSDWLLRSCNNGIALVLVGTGAVAGGGVFMASASAPNSLPSLATAFLCVVGMFWTVTLFVVAVHQFASG